MLNVMKSTHLIKAAAGVRIGNNLDRCWCAVGHIQSRWYIELTDAKVTKHLDYELWAQLDAESRSRVVPNSHIDSDICLGMAHVQLQRAATDGPVGALLLNIAITATWELFCCIFTATSGGRPVESEMSQRAWYKSKREDCVGEHIDFCCKLTRQKRVE